jgi:hypothetical protein
VNDHPQDCEDDAKPEGAQPADDLSGIDIHALSEIEWRREVLQRLAHGRARMDDMESALATNTAETTKTATALAQALPLIGHIHEIVETAQSFFRGLAKVSAFFARMWVWLGPLMRAVSVLAGAATAVKLAYITYRGGNPPPPRSH